jgi:hypothetical protein
VNGVSDVSLVSHHVTATLLPSAATSCESTAVVLLRFTLSPKVRPLVRFEKKILSIFEIFSMLSSLFPLYLIESIVFYSIDHL